ncbi:hypothetical protein J3F84DRAFT_362888 [Trichoderma pleuroticola]
MAAFCLGITMFAAVGDIRYCGKSVTSRWKALWVLIASRPRRGRCKENACYFSCFCFVFGTWIFLVYVHNTPNFSRSKRLLFLLNTFARLLFLSWCEFGLAWMEMGLVWR